MPLKETSNSGSKTSTNSMPVGMASNSRQNAVKILEGQHREVEGLFAEIEKAGGTAFKVKEKLFEKLSEKLLMHIDLEEEIFYPASQQVAAVLTQEAIEEHANIKGMLAKLADLGAEDETFEAKVKVLEELVSHHVEEEEKDLFPKCEMAVGREKMQALGREIEKKMNHDETRLSKKSKVSDSEMSSRAH